VPKRLSVQIGEIDQIAEGLPDRARHRPVMRTSSSSVGMRSRV
jgi:hypothetical protein